MNTKLNSTRKTSETYLFTDLIYTTYIVDMADFHPRIILHLALGSDTRTQPSTRSTFWMALFYIDHELYVKVTGLTQANLSIQFEQEDDDEYDAMFRRSLHIHIQHRPTKWGRMCIQWMADDERAKERPPDKNSFSQTHTLFLRRIPRGLYSEEVWRWNY